MPRGGAREGAGRPAKSLTWGQRVAESQGLTMWACPWIVKALIDAARNGDTSAGKYLLDRVWGRADHVKPFSERADEILALLPDDWNPEAMLNAPWESFCATIGGEFTEEMVEKLGRAGLEILRQRALRGCRESANTLLQYWKGLPVQPVETRIATMTEEEASAELIRLDTERFQRGLGLDEAKARAMAELLACDVASAPAQTACKDEETNTNG